MPSHTIHHALRPQDPQHRPAPARDLRAPGVLDDAGAEPQGQRLRLQQQHLLLGLDLQRDLGLAAALPAAEDGRVGGLGQVVFVAGEGGVGALCGDFACGSGFTKSDC